MSICSPGSVCIISLKCTESDPRPVAMTSAGTNHGYGPVVLQGQSRAREIGMLRQWTPMHRGAADQGSAMQAQGTTALAVGCSGLGGCKGSGL